MKAFNVASGRAAVILVISVFTYSRHNVVDINVHNLGIDINIVRIKKRRIFQRWQDGIRKRRGECVFIRAVSLG